MRTALTPPWLMLLALWSLFGVARAAPLPALPPELEPWVPWVMADQPDWACPRVGATAVCVWPGRLDIEATDRGARFDLSVFTDRSVEVPLPGGPGLWPQDLRREGLLLPVLDREGRPFVVLPAGSHRLSGLIPWASQPPTLPLPRAMGLVSLRLNGDPVTAPVIEDDGSLRLGAASAGSTAANSVEIEVNRRLQDGVPMRVTTHIAVRVAGASRELALGAIDLAGATPVHLEGDLPARLDPALGLVVQARPGTFSLRLESVLPAGAASIAVPSGSAPGWPDRETWLVVPDEGVRAAVFAGLVSVDPSRVSLPAEWGAGSTFLAPAGAALTVTELRRGDPSPPPNHLRVERQLWLDLDGEGFTARDILRGTMSQGWRLVASAPLQPGRITLEDEGQVITEAEGDAGVELRTQQVLATSEGRLPRAAGAFPAVGWQLEAAALSVAVSLPPDWRLLYAVGPDHVYGALIEELSAPYLVLGIGLAALIARIWGLRTGLVAALTFGLAWLMPESPRLGWIVLVGLAAARKLGLLQRLSLPGWGKGLLIGSGLSLVAATLFCMGLSFTGNEDAAPERFAQLQMEQKPMVAGDVETTTLEDGAGGYNMWRGPVSSAGEKASPRKVQLGQDPSAIVQTGPGLPTWQGATVLLNWEGPVSAEAPLRLILLPPWLVGAWLLAGAILSKVLLVYLFGLEAWIGALITLLRTPGPETLQAALPAFLRKAAPLLILGLLASAPAQAAPSPELLSELKTRLGAPEACAPRCVVASRAWLRTQPNALEVEVELHAAAAGAWSLPGPSRAWSPEAVTLDGAPGTALRRDESGFLQVRVPPGVHRLRISGPTPAVEALTLQWVEAPQRVDVEGEGWTVIGLRPDGRSDSALQLLRTAGAEKSGAPGSGSALAPWLEVHRTLDLGLPWRVTTVVRRSGAGVAPVNARVPLLPGESVTDAAVDVKDGAAQIALSAASPEVSWSSTLATAEAIRLVAPTDVPWTEIWELRCSPIFRCALDPNSALPPVRHIEEGRWEPLFRPLPGESLTVTVSRPTPAEGAAATVRAVHLSREGDQGTLEIEVMASQGGRTPITLPPGATLRTVTVDGAALPAQVDEGRLHLPIRPGLQRFTLVWSQPEAGFSLLRRVPTPEIGAPAVNVHTRLTLPNREVALFTFGPDWGPRIWGGYSALVLGLIGLLLARINTALEPTRRLPMGAPAFVLLCLGLVELPQPLCLLPPAAMALALGARHRGRLPWRIDLWALAGGALLLAAAALAGLVFGLDLEHDTGPGAGALSWYVDRTAGPLPSAGALVVPRSLTQVAYGLWTLWLLSRLPGLVAALRRPPGPPPSSPTEELTPPLRPVPPELGAMRVGRRGTAPPIEDRVSAVRTDAPPTTTYDADVFVPSLITESPDLRAPSSNPEEDEAIEANSATFTGTFTAASLQPPIPLGPEQPRPKGDTT